MVKRKYRPISIHETLEEKLELDWDKEYNNDFCCLNPSCHQHPLNYYFSNDAPCHLILFCNSCKKKTYLTNKLRVQISNYVSELECPNPLCTKNGPNSQKGWIYKINNSGGSSYKCNFCGVVFNPNATIPQSWVGSNNSNQFPHFSDESDCWYLQNFYENPINKTLNFESIQPSWYKNKVKNYIHYLLKSRAYSSDGSVVCVLVILRKFGRVIQSEKINNLVDINRQTILSFLEQHRNNKPKTVCASLSCLKGFLAWMNLEVSLLIRSYDFPKVSKNDTDWLDEVTRKAIQKHLQKIPEPIARHYLVQEFTAARPIDVCLMTFNCLVEENQQWYVKFYQHKNRKGWKRIPATREIRRIIEAQQIWIREHLGEDYSYLFCHFWGIRKTGYPNFKNLKVLSITPKINANRNPMVRIIRMLIDHENILDPNGQKPHFTGEITRDSRLQEIRIKYGIEAARLYADHESSRTTLQHYTPPTREEVAKVDLPFQELLLNPENKFLPWQSLPESLLKNPKAHELDMEIFPRLVVYGHCTLDPKTPCIHNLYPQCYGCSSFRPSTGKLPFYERQYAAEQQRMKEASLSGAELAYEEAKSTLDAMDNWLPNLRKVAHGEET